jgi:hypothetical protein
MTASVFVFMCGNFYFGIIFSRFAERWACEHRDKDEDSNKKRGEAVAVKEGGKGGMFANYTYRTGCALSSCYGASTSICV